MKSTFYFSHDYTAHTDPKVEKLIYDIGWDAYGLYWAIIEKLALEGGVMDKDFKRLAFILRVEEEKIKRIICDYNLFVVDENNFSSRRLTEHLESREALSEAGKRGVAIREAKKKKEGGHKGWHYTTVEALKERKGKESKVNNILFNNKTPPKKKENYNEIKNLLEKSVSPPNSANPPQKKINHEIIELAELMARGISFCNPAFSQKWKIEKSEPLPRAIIPVIERWAEDLEKLVRIDNAEVAQVRQVIIWLYSGNSKNSLFWRGNILSGTTLRRQYQKIVANALAEKNNQPNLTDLSV